MAQTPKLNDGCFYKNLIWFWSLIALPFVLVIVLFILISNEKLGPMPLFEELENPENNLAASLFRDGVCLESIISRTGPE
ncbi:MAG: hypothetical protein U0X39_04850 [Bacteroidales bacterium]